MTKIPLGELLVEDGILTPDQLQTAMDIQKKEGGLIGVILINLGHIDEKTLIKYLALQTESVINSK